MKFEYTRYTKEFLQKNIDPTVSTDKEELLLGLIMNFPDNIFKVDARYFATEETWQVWQGIKDLDSTSPAQLQLAIKDKKFFDYAIQLRNNATMEHPSMVDKVLFKLEILRIQHLKKMCATEKLRYISDNSIISEIEVFEEKESMPFMDISYESLGDTIDNTVEGIISGKIAKGYLTGMDSLDTMMGYITEDDVVVLAARPAMGKTSFSIQLIDSIIRTNWQPFLMNTLEVPKPRLITKFLSYYSGIPERDLRINKDGILSSPQIADAMKKFKEIEDFLEIVEGKYTPKELEICVMLNNARRKAKGLKPIKFVWQDFLNIKESGKDLFNQKSEIDFVLKEEIKSSKKSSFILINLVQISRSVETRGGSKKPQLQDLKDSGKIEESARKVIFLHRDEYYGILEDEEGNSTVGTLTVIIAKNSNGGTGTVVFKDINLACNRVYNPTYEKTEIQEFENAYNPAISRQSDFNGHQITENTPF
jgi:replicative DNA helicase